MGVLNMPDFYGTVADADTYHAARSNTAWTGDNAAKEAALLRASVYVDGLGICMDDGQPVSKFPGTKTGGRSQVRAWPRVGASDIDGEPLSSDTVPIEVENATYEAALREIANPGSLTPDYVPSRLVKREKVDVIDTEYAVAQDGAPGTNPTRPVVTAALEILAPVMISGYAYPGAVVV